MPELKARASCAAAPAGVAAILPLRALGLFSPLGCYLYTARIQTPDLSVLPTRGAPLRRVSTGPVA